MKNFNQTSEPCNTAGQMLGRRRKIIIFIFISNYYEASLVLRKGLYKPTIKFLFLSIISKKGTKTGRC